ncbi:SGNH/GDSL hydrolase family protein [Anaerolineales bacterium HSG25]|nr:SGNH/GDSL hydrolase family protein [Anaerolineales bacterium HSG25]
MTQKANRETYIIILLVFCSLLLSFGILEIVIRYFGVYDENNNFVFADTPLKPYQLPINTTQDIIDDYLSSSTSRLMYDPDLGWAPRPNSQSKNELYRYNSMGIRSMPLEYSITPQPDVLRIALFGDSYTHGDDVTFENSWGYYLENNLKKNGIQAEVINFGVSGYGMDQAFLRWRKLGQKYSPDIVILGFDAENVNRNVNLIRVIYKPKTGLPLSKPRFIFADEALQVINVPAILPENIVNTMQNIETWELARHEYFFNSQDNDSIWLKSRLIAFLFSLNSDTDSQLYSLDKEPAQLTIKIIQQFKQEVEAEGHQFFVAHLPRHSHTATLLSQETLAYTALLSEIAKTVTVIYPEDRLIEEAKASSLKALYKGHYSPKGNEVIADVIAEFFISSHN